MGGAHFTTPSLWQRRLRAAQVSLAITSPYKPPQFLSPSTAWEDRDPLWLGGELRSPSLSFFWSPTLFSWSCAEPFAAGLCVYLLGCGEIPGKPGLPPNQILGAMNDIPLGPAPVLSVRFKRAQDWGSDLSTGWLNDPNMLLELEFCTNLLFISNVNITCTLLTRVLCEHTTMPYCTRGYLVHTNHIKCSNNLCFISGAY